MDAAEGSVPRMSTAEAPLARLCSRQTCRRPARTTLTFVYSDSTAVIGPLSVHAEPHAYDLCVPHAQRMTPPRGWEIVRLEGVPESQDDDAPAARLGDLVADSAPLAPLSALPGAARDERSTSRSEPEAHSAGPEDSAGDDAPGNPSGSAPRGWGRRRRSRLRAVSGPVAEGAPAGTDADEPSGEDIAQASELDGDSAFDSLMDEIFAGSTTDYVSARRGARSQPEAMRRPHLRRGRS